jgi:hypothetical protein
MHRLIGALLLLALSQLLACDSRPKKGDCTAKQHPSPLQLIKQRISRRGLTWHHSFHSRLLIWALWFYL